MRLNKSITDSGLDFSADALSDGNASMVARAILNLLRGAVFVIDGNCDVLMANAQALRLIDTDSTIGFVNGRFTVNTVEGAETLRATVRAMLDNGVTTVEAFSLRRHDGLRPLAVLLRRLDGDLESLGLIVVQVTATDGATPPDQSLLCSLFGLTPAEGALLHGLMRDRRVDEIAIERGVSITTVRTQLAHLFRKTGTNRQSELVRLGYAATGILITPGNGEAIQ